MLAILMSTILFAFLTFLGNILMFVDESAYWLIPFFFISMLMIQFLYRQPNCHSLEYKDFVLTTFLTLIFSIFILFINKEVTYHEFWYFYLITFISLILFADSRRFKSLM
ncbi:MAG: hypothetical protein RR531_14270 [Longicatena sp.]